MQSTSEMKSIEVKEKRNDNLPNIYHVPNILYYFFQVSTTLLLSENYYPYFTEVRTEVQ